MKYYLYFLLGCAFYLFLDIETHFAIDVLFGGCLTLVILYIKIKDEL